ncbi:MAG: MaoC family dehydratase N-terminal domain-containing protein [Porticoccaceae bacterium]|nr:MaoC family dehydratase N-terminal domain-containing protein [Porticoccaceae bacterium]
MTDQNVRWGVIDEESIAEAQALIGVPLRRDRMRWNQTATADAIRQFCEGVGDDNPLWADSVYATSSRWQGQLATPAFLYSIDATIVAPKLPGVQWIYAGTRWRWYDVVRVNDEFDVTAKLTDMKEKQGRRFGLWVLQTGEIEFHRPNGSLVCIAQGRVARTPRRKRSTSVEAAKDSKTDSTAEASVTAVADRPASSTTGSPLGSARRGSTPRLWEDVQINDQLPTIGIVLTLEQIFAWYTGAQGALHYGGAHEDGVRYRHRHDDFEINAKTGAKDSAARGHFSSKEGKDVGMGGTYDVGLQRIAWVIAYVTDWMGDDAHLAEADIDVVAPNLTGDTTYISAEVTARWFDEHPFVELKITGHNQSDRITTTGSALVVLPSTQYGAVRVPLFQGHHERWTAAPHL